MLEYISNRVNDYDAGKLLNELALAAKNLGILESKIDSYQFDAILIPMLLKKEAVSSMYIEGTQTTVPDILKNEIDDKATDDKIQMEVRNHAKTLIMGADHLRSGKFTHSFIKKLHEYMMTGIIKPGLEDTVGKYKSTDNHIKSTAGKVIYNPPSASETKRYMDELITFMNNSNDNIHPLIKAAMIHSQFESIHPFSDGNGRIGRVLISLYLYKSGVINFPFFLHKRSNQYGQRYLLQNADRLKNQFTYGMDKIFSYQSQHTNKSTHWLH